MVPKHAILLAALAALVVAAFLAGLWWGDDGQALAALQAEKQALKARLDAELAQKDAALAQAVERADKAEKQAELATEGYLALKRKKRAIIEETMKPEAIHLTFKRRGYNPILPPSGGYFVAFAQEDAEKLAKTLRVGENCETRAATLEDVVGKQRAAIASLRQGLVISGEKLDLLETYAKEREDIAKRETEAMEGIIAKERKKAWAWKLVAGAAVGTAIYAGAQ